MGTVFHFKIADAVDGKQIESDVAKACSILVDADERFSLYKSDSEISRLNRGEIPWAEASGVQRDMKTQVESWKDITSGYFDPVSPDGVYDPSGLVKTWAASNASMYLEANGYRDFTLNAGGDVYLGPEVKTHPLTRVGLSNLKPIASKESSVNMIVDLSGSSYRAVATSGIAERGEHIWRQAPKNDQDIYIQATVVASDLVTADIWATALIAGGPAALAQFELVVVPEDAVAVVTSASGKITSTQGFTAILANLA